MNVASINLIGIAMIAAAAMLTMSYPHGGGC